MNSLHFAIIYLLALAVFAISPATWATDNAVTKNAQPWLVSDK